MVSLKGIRNLSILMVILMSLVLVFEQVKIVNSIYIENALTNEQIKQAQDEPINDGNLGISSVTNITEYGQWDGNLGSGVGSITFNQYTIFITTKEVHVIDKTDLANPVFVRSWYNLSEGLTYLDFELRGDILYLLDSYSNITMTNISDIENFEILSTTSVGYSIKMEQYEDLLFLYGLTKLRIYNISSSSSIELIADYPYESYFSGFISDLEIINQTAYFISSNILRIFNLTNPDNIMEISNTTLTTNHITKIAVKDDFAIIATTTQGIIVYNVTNITKPIFLYNFLNETDDYEYKELFFIDDYLLVFNYLFGLILCDASNLSDIFHIQSKVINRAIHIDKNLNTLTIGEYYKYLHYIDISDIMDITTLGSFDFGGNSIGVTAQGNFVYLANGGSGLEIISVANPDNPIRVANAYLNSSYADGVLVSNNLAFVACYSDGVYIIDIANPLEPIILSKYESSLDHHQYYDLAIKGNLLYIANGYAGVEIIDISIPSSPHFIKSFNTNYSFAQAIDIQDDIAVVVDGTIELAIFDISSPVHPTMLNTVTSYDWSPNEVRIDGDYVYVLNYYDGFSIIDIKKPFDPKVVIDYEIPDIDFFRDIAVWGEYVYLTSYHDGLFIVDCIDMESPVLVQKYDNENIFFEIFAHNGFVFVANSYNGLLIFSAIKTRVNGYEIPITALILSIGLMTFYLCKNRRKKQN